MSTDPITPDFAAPETPATPSTPSSSEPASLAWETAPEAFRRGHEELRSKYEPYEKLGATPEQIQQHMSVVSRLSQEASSLASRLGYSSEEIREALQHDPIRTLQFLQREAFAAQSQQQPQQAQQPQPDINRLAQQHAAMLEQQLAQQIQPYQEMVNKHVTEGANARFESVFDQEYRAFAKDDVDPAERDFLYNLTSELLDDDALARIKWEGKTSDIKAAFNHAKDLALHYFQAKSIRQSQKTHGKPKAAAAPAKGKTKGLNDFIDGDFDDRFKVARLPKE